MGRTPCQVHGDLLGALKDHSSGARGQKIVYMVGNFTLD